MNYDKCKNKPWKEYFNDCKTLEYCCYICKDIVKVKNYIKHFGDHFVIPIQYLAFNMCEAYKHISFLRRRKGRCRLCIYLNRYRFTYTGNQFGEHVYKYNICDVGSP